ncbi:non-muscle caldesmon-like isoform X5 [Oncorhynchus keta]|uniref:non-muscle caldesmon-like isoform X5 n=1 Tax=Oncorhynchus keta TaxID=8018 RepID=UPI0015FD5CED|nr:non-muscle caldesmon-like isoform X5 [Oncorhynchus keta]XP_035640121.1 non-muscle caldesmon-like isoform X5 [Oncorhynchus keta]XP_035640122.1 non-muscle caldesmon-like isoform X5 [Oncorhynchus keta]
MDDDFERRRELRRQKREEMRLEAERVTETVSVSSSSMTSSGGGDDDEQALLERMAKREERRQKRLMEALEREKDQNPGNDGNHGSGENTVEERSVGRRGRYQDNEEEVEERNCRKEEEGEAAPEEEEAEQGEEEADEEVVEEEKPRQSYMREQESIDVNTRNEEDTEEQAVVLNEVEESEAEAEVEENAALSDKVEEEVEEPDQLEVEGTTVTLNNETEEDCRMSTIQNGLDVVNEKQNGGLHEETPQKHKKTERTLSRGSVRSAGAEEQDDTAPLEAELKLEELKRRRDDAESEEFERMRRKQQEAEQELEELKKKREERRKIIEEEERQKKQEEAEKKDREEEEKRRMKEEIERRRAEAAEKRQQMGVETVDAEAKPFKCFSPRGSSLKIGERAEFLSKSAQKSTVKSTHSPVVSKIDNRLEQYTSVAQNKDMRSPRSGAVDLPMVTDGIRNIKSMWEKGSVFNSPGGGGGTYKEAAGMKIGVAGRINDWLNKTPESKTPGGRPADLKPGDVTNKRSLWENKGSSPAKVTGRGENKSVANAGMGHE